MEVRYLLIFLGDLGDSWTPRVFIRGKIYETWTKRQCNICLRDNVPRARSAHTPTVPKHG